MTYSSMTLPGRLAVDDGRTRCGITTLMNSHLLTQRLIHILPYPFHSPEAEVVIDSLPWREVMGKHPPGYSTPDNVEYGVEDLPHICGARSSAGSGGRDQWLDDGLFCVGQVCGYDRRCMMNLSYRFSDTLLHHSLGHYFDRYGTPLGQFAFHLSLSWATVFADTGASCNSGLSATPRDGPIRALTPVCGQ